MSSFVTEFGHEIPFIPGYFKGNKRYSYFGKATEVHDGLKVVEGKELEKSGPLKDWVEFSKAVHFMAKYGLLKTYKRGVDLGGAEGTFMRMLRAAGFVKHATSVDIDNYTKVVNDDFFERLLLITKNIEDANPGAQLPVQQAKQSFDHYSHMSLGHGMVTEFS